MSMKPALIYPSDNFNFDLYPLARSKVASLAHHGNWRLILPNLSGVSYECYRAARSTHLPCMVYGTTATPRYTANGRYIVDVEDYRYYAGSLPLALWLIQQARLVVLLDECRPLALYARHCRKDVTTAGRGRNVWQLALPFAA